MLIFVAVRYLQLCRWSEKWCAGDTFHCWYEMCFEVSLTQQSRSGRDSWSQISAWWSVESEMLSISSHTHVTIRTASRWESCWLQNRLIFSSSWQQVLSLTLQQMLDGEGERTKEESEQANMPQGFVFSRRLLKDLQRLMIKSRISGFTFRMFSLGECLWAKMRNLRHNKKCVVSTAFKNISIFHPANPTLLQKAFVLSENTSISPNTSR